MMPDKTKNKSPRLKSHETMSMRVRGLLENMAGKPGTIKSIEEILPQRPSGKAGRIKSIDDLLPKPPAAPLENQDRRKFAPYPTRST